MATARQRLTALVKADPALAERLLRVAESPAPAGPITTAWDMYTLVRPLLVGRTTEALVCVALDRKLRLLGMEILTTGSDSYTVVCPKQLLRWALLQGRSGAHGIVIAHNHPSGDVVPSAQDVEVTRRVSRAAISIGIPLYDHLIVTDAAYTSFAERGELPSWGNT